MSFTGRWIPPNGVKSYRAGGKVSSRRRCSCSYNSLVIPCGLDPQGMPFGVQLVGKRWGEAALLSIGLALEAALADDADCRRPLPDIAKLSRR